MIAKSRRTRKRPINLLVRVDGNDRIGFGHAVRVSSLLHAIKLPLRTAVASYDAPVANLFPRGRLELLSKRHSFRAVLARYNYDAVVVDLPRPAPGLWEQLRRTERPVIAVDDYGGAIAADLIVNGTVLPEYHRYPSRSIRGRVLVGPRYILIRPEFGKTRWTKPRHRSVAIVIGSGRRAHDWAFKLASSSLNRSGWGRVTMVVGTAFPKLELLSRACSKAGIILRHGLPANALSTLFARSSVGLITGGMVVYEALAVGVPAVIFPQMTNLVREANWFKAQRCARIIGFHQGFDMDYVGREVTALLHDEVLAQRMSTRARKVIDGRGTTRAASAIVELLQPARTKVV